MVGNYCSSTDMITAILLTAIGLGLLGTSRTAQGIGRLKRRIYVEIEAAQQRGIDFANKYYDLTSAQQAALTEVGERFGWKQTRRSIESGKSYSEAYYNSLRRAYNAIAGVHGIGAIDHQTHRVRNSEGKVILEWNDYQPAAEHVQAEQDLEALEARLAKLRAKNRRARRAGFNNAPTPSNYQDEQLYNESQFPTGGEQLALFGVSGPRRYFGGNSGYDGYSMSKRAVEARADGKFPKTDFKRVYSISENTLEVLVKLDIINDNEWHHTSMWGNRITFYSWDDNEDGLSDFSVIYKENKKAIDKLCKDYVLLPRPMITSRQFESEIRQQETSPVNIYCEEDLAPGQKDEIQLEYYRQKKSLEDEIIDFFE